MSLFGREHGVKQGQGGIATDDMLKRRRLERIQQVTSQVFNLKDDPYLLQTHTGSFECKLCFTTHRTQESYMMHTEGKKHKMSLENRSNLLEKKKKTLDTDKKVTSVIAPVKQRVTIGQPAYKVVKQYDPETLGHSLLFRIEYSLIAPGTRPRYRIVSSYEQQIEAPSDTFQYIVFAAEPYDNIGFKIPNIPISKAQDRQLFHWDAATHTLILVISFLDEKGSKWRKMQEKQREMTQQQYLQDDNTNNHGEYMNDQDNQRYMQ